MNNIEYIIGDATSPVEIEGMKFIAHCCNNRGLWGSGFVLALSYRWGMPELMYKQWSERSKEDMRSGLGKIQIIPVERDIMVVNIIGQDGVGKDDNGNPPIRYDAIRMGLKKLQDVMLDYKNSSIHLPRIGAARAGGKWSIIEQIILEEINQSKVYVYTLPSERHIYGL